MNKPIIFGTVLFGLLAWSAIAQDTNVLKTELGEFEARTGTVIVKGFTQVGSLAVGQTVITVRCKESTDINTGHKADGLAIEVAGQPPLRERILVDYDEIDSLLNGINYLNKITYNVTALQGFEAGYSTKAGLRVVANSVRRQGGIQASLEYGDDPRILLTSDQMSQLYGLIEQARNTLDSLPASK